MKQGEKEREGERKIDREERRERQGRTVKGREREKWLEE